MVRHGSQAVMESGSVAPSEPLRRYVMQPKHHSRQTTAWTDGVVAGCRCIAFCKTPCAQPGILPHYADILCSRPARETDNQPACQPPSQPETARQRASKVANQPADKQDRHVQQQSGQPTNKTGRQAGWQRDNQLASQKAIQRPRPTPTYPERQIVPVPQRRTERTEHRPAGICARGAALYLTNAQPCHKGWGSRHPATGPQVRERGSGAAERSHTPPQHSRQVSAPSRLWMLLLRCSLRPCKGTAWTLAWCTTSRTCFYGVPHLAHDGRQRPPLETDRPPSNHWSPSAVDYPPTAVTCGTTNRSPSPAGPRRPRR